MTKVGAKINNLRQTIENKDVKKQMRNLIKQWKALTEKDSKSTVPSAKLATEANNSQISSDHQQNGQKTHQQTNGVSKQNGITNNNNKNSITPPTKSSTPQNQPGFTTPIDYCGDKTRDKARDLLGKALRSQFPDPIHSACNRCAVNLEKALHNHYSSDMKKYKNQLMSKISNLKDPKNPDLRNSFLNGVINADKLATMTTQEMMSNDLKKLNEKYEKENLSEAQTAVNAGTETDMFTCFKCKGKRCTYTQLQTRSSDEPMTTFVFCMDCGNRWKFC